MSENSKTGEFYSKIALSFLKSVDALWSTTLGST